ncbi:hypothetical protein KAR91_55565 [Candidatus Pacearchaeota archaeon]|nr:hypothetical protein [Candidatus Pacearchaeota archaeon]
MSEWIDIKKEQPGFDIPVNVTLEHWHTKGRKEAVLQRVDADDHNWEFDGGCELSHDWDVILWSPI